MGQRPIREIGHKPGRVLQISARPIGLRQSRGAGSCRWSQVAARSRPRSAPKGCGGDLWPHRRPAIAPMPPATPSTSPRRAETTLKSNWPPIKILCQRWRLARRFNLRTGRPTGRLRQSQRSAGATLAAGEGRERRAKLARGRKAGRLGPRWPLALAEKWIRLVARGRRRSEAGLVGPTWSHAQGDGIMLLL